MPESRVYTTHRNYPLVRKASSPTEQRDWMDEEVDLAEAIDTDVQNIYDIISTTMNLQGVLDAGSTATIDTDIEVSVVKDAPLSGNNNPIHVNERIRNTATLGATEKAAQMRRRAEGTAGTSYSESNQTVSESNTTRDFISDIAAVDVQTARIRCRVQNGVATITESAQTKTVNLNGNQTVAVEKDVLEGTVTDTESVKNIGLDATTGDVSFAKKVIIVESDNDTAGGLGTAGRLTLTAEASNEAGYAGSSALNVEAFDGAVEKRIVSSGILGGTTFHDIIAQSFLVNGEPQGVQFVTTVADTPHVMTIASAKKIIFEGSASNSPCELPAANSTATLSDGTVVTMRGRSFELVNASSEFLPVQNSGTASSVFELLGPGCTLSATCTGVSTAAGTWSIIQNEPSWFHDFLGNQLAADYKGWNPSNGTGAGTDINGAIQSASCQGLLSHNTGTSSATAHSCIRAGGRYGSKTPVHYFAKVLPPTIQTDAEDYLYEFGLGDNLTTLTTVDGIVWRLPPKSSTNLYWSAEVLGGSVSTERISSIAHTSSPTRLDILVNTARTRADFWINRVHMTPITANLPGTNTTLYPMSKFVKVSGTSDRRLDVDYIGENFGTLKGNGR